jgi:hypothetical protein
MMGSNSGSHWELLVDGKPRSYRDTEEIAMEAGQYLKGLHPHAEVVIRDMRSNVSRPVVRAAVMPMR